MEEPETVWWLDLTAGMSVSRPGLGLETDQDHFFEVLVLVSTLLVLVLISASLVLVSVSGLGLSGFGLVLVSDSLVSITSLPD